MIIRFIPPYVNPEKSNVKNSENTALFLVSCFEYIFIGIVLNAGRPFRQPMTQNCKSILPKIVDEAMASKLTNSPDPFMTTILVVVAIVVYMVFTPARWLRKLMQLTYISSSFKVTLLILGGVYLVLAWIGEHYIFQPLARAIGNAKYSLTKTKKQRKEYKIINERMRT
jgi:cation-transporting P-type ATPase 13A2